MQKVEITLIDRKVATAQQQSDRQHFNPAFEGRMTKAKTLYKELDNSTLEVLGF